MLYQPTDLGTFRLRHLTNNISQTRALLQEYEYLMQLEANPARRSTYLQKLEQLRALITRQQEECQELQMLLEAERSLDDANSQLQEIDTKLNAVVAEQSALQARITDAPVAAADPVDEAQRAISRAVLIWLDSKQLTESQIVLEAITARKIPQKDLQATLNAVQQMLHELHQRELSFPFLSIDDVRHVIESVEDPKRDSNQRLAITVPLIPLFLSHAEKMKLQSGPELDATWQRMVNKVRGKP